jgi:hypothetical protein
MSSLNILCQNEMTIATRIPDEASTLAYKRWPFSIILSASNYRLCVSLWFPNNFTSNFFQMLYVPLIVAYKKIVSNKEPSHLKHKEKISENRIVYFHSQVFSEKFPSASISASSTTTKLLRDASLPFDDDL